MSEAHGFARLLAGIRAGEATPATFPKAWAFSGLCAGIESRPRRDPDSFTVPLRGQRSFGRRLRALLLLPV
jgi:hypothetical protein